MRHHLIIRRDAPNYRHPGTTRPPLLLRFVLHLLPSRMLLLSRRQQDETAEESKTSSEVRSHLEYANAQRVKTRPPPLLAQTTVRSGSDCQNNLLESVNQINVHHEHQPTAVVEELKNDHSNPPLHSRSFSGIACLPPSPPIGANYFRN